MTREFLKCLGLEDSVIDSIMAENEQDVSEEKQKTKTAKADLSEAQGKLATAQADLEALRQSSGDADGLRQQLETLQTEAATLRDQLADRDYADALKSAVAGKGLKFSSRGAERDFMAQLKEKRLELKDGELTGLDDFIQSQREADPYAFASDKPAPRFLGPVGAGWAPPPHMPANVAQAKEMGAARAAALQASNDAMKAFM